ncbi:hypothetical protein [Streptosporangium longisporum]|uniref:Uncharacterized protein n=1 Tax=Streptosporangium longisporum TaxID=46187 RepID=A0ABP6LCJ7_9ACTN
MTPAERLATALLALNTLDAAMVQPEPQPRQDDPARTKPKKP